MSAIVLDPSAPGVATSIVPERHVYKTTDGGGHWSVPLPVGSSYLLFSEATSSDRAGVDPAIRSRSTRPGRHLRSASPRSGTSSRARTAAEAGPSFTGTLRDGCDPRPRPSTSPPSSVYVHGARSRTEERPGRLRTVPAPASIPPEPWRSPPPRIATLYIDVRSGIPIRPARHAINDRGLTLERTGRTGDARGRRPDRFADGLLAGPGGVLRVRSNAGATWTDENDGLPDPTRRRSRSIPPSPSRVYAGTRSRASSRGTLLGRLGSLLHALPDDPLPRGNRFKAEVAWSVPSDGRTGHGMARPLTTDTGAFWFFSADNIELVLKVLDGRLLNGAFWVFYGALSDVQYTSP